MHCDDFHRTRNVTRRTFLKRSLGTGLAIYSAQALSFERMFEAAAQAPADQRILVSVFLPGGVDLLDSIVPRGQYGAYRKARPFIAQPENSPSLGSTGYAVHTALARGDRGGIKGLFDEGRIGLLPGIDYAKPDLSHFHSREFWETGLITARSATGWLGRWLDAQGPSENPFRGLSAGYELAPPLISSSSPVAAVNSADSGDLGMQGVWNGSLDRALATYRALGAARPGDAPQPAAARRGVRLASEVATRLAPYADSAPQRSEGNALAELLAGGNIQGYPPGSDFGDRLKSLAFMLAQPLGVRVATVDASGDFDTHDGQQQGLLTGLTDVSASLAAFQNDIEARGLGDRVLTFVWSEFGRRVQQNDSGGTDHGAGGLAWVMGARAKSGLLSEYPSLGALDKQGNLKVTVDFRSVYASLIEQWLGTDAAAVIPDAGSVGRLALVK